MEQQDTEARPEAVCPSQAQCAVLLNETRPLAPTSLPLAERVVWMILMVLLVAIFLGYMHDASKMRVAGLEQDILTLHTAFNAEAARTEMVRNSQHGLIKTMDQNVVRALQEIVTKVNAVGADVTALKTVDDDGKKKRR